MDLLVSLGRFRSVDRAFCPHEPRNGSDIPSMRNWPLFAFLAGLVFFFYVFYVYQAQSTEFAMTRSELDDQMQKVRNLKRELFDAKAELERLKSSEASLKSENEKSSKLKEECSNSLRSCKLNTENLQAQVKKAEETSSLKEQQTKDLQAKIDELTKANEDLRKNASDREEERKQLKAELEKLQSQLNERKSHGKDVVAPAADQNVPVARDDGVSGTERKQRSFEVEEKKSETLNDNNTKEFRISNDLAGKMGLVAKVPEDEKKDAPQVVPPPQHHAQEVKSRLAAAEHDDDGQEKPVVKGGDYEDKLGSLLKVY
ncbi:hypothetical protein RB195_004691 [Necator americanus]|uniref:Uncharacterized protein n=1 Tax=Necator americanus TaxID=51031 RepID=A0ABR1BML1_NECAM